MTRQVHDPQRVAGDGQRGGVFEIGLGARDAGIHSGNLVAAQAPAEQQRVLPVHVLHDLWHPVVAAGQVVHRLVGTLPRVVLVAAECRRRRHVARLATEVTRRVVLVVAAGAGAKRRGARGLDRAVLQIRGQRQILGDQCLRQKARLVLAERALDDAVLVRRVVERGLVLDVARVRRRVELAVEGARIQRLLRAVVRREVADHGVGHVVAGTAEVHRAMVQRLFPLMPRYGVAIGAELRAPIEQRQLAAAVMTFRRAAAVVGDERREQHAEMFGIIGVGHLVADVATDAVGGVGVRQRRPVGRCRTAGLPADRRVAADAQVAGAVEVLLGDGERRPEDRIAPGVGHHAAAPVLLDRDDRVVVLVAVFAPVGRFEIADFARLGARHLRLHRHRCGCPRGRPQAEANSDHQREARPRRMPAAHEQP